MLKLLLSKACPTPARLLRVSGCVSFTTQTEPITPNSPLRFTQKDDSLYYRLWPVWEPSTSLVPILDQWVSENKPVNANHLRKIIKQFRSYRRFRHALQISEWMGDKNFIDLAPGDVAVELDLISKVHGPDQAEKYFNSLPLSSRALQVYGALLNCYAESKSLEKAENVMQKMRELGYCQLLGYNVMLSLYSRMEKYEKIDGLVQEMEEKGIDHDLYSFNIRLNAYVAASDIEEMEKLLMKMEVNPQIVLNWSTYVIAAKGYLKAGNKANAMTVLKKCEQLIGGNVNLAYQVLLTLYASLGKKSDLYRIWDMLKKFGKFRNMDYLSMISSLEKLDDLENAKIIMEEWLTKKKYFDNRIPNLLISAYCKRNQLDKAELLLEELKHAGFKPDASTWSRMAFGYFKFSDKEKAVEMMKEAILITDWRLTIDLLSLASCVQYLKGKGETDRAEELIQLLEARGPFSIDVRSKIMQSINQISNLASEEINHFEGEANETMEDKTLEDARLETKQPYL